MKIHAKIPLLSMLAGRVLTFDERLLIGRTMPYAMVKLVLLLGRISTYDDAISTGNVELFWYIFYYKLRRYQLAVSDAVSALSQRNATASGATSRINVKSIAASFLSRVEHDEDNSNFFDYLIIAAKADDMEFFSVFCYDSRLRDRYVFDVLYHNIVFNYLLFSLYIVLYV